MAKEKAPFDILSLRAELKSSRVKSWANKSIEFGPTPAPSATWREVPSSRKMHLHFEGAAFARPPAASARPGSWFAVNAPGTEVSSRLLLRSHGPDGGQVHSRCLIHV